MNEFYLEQLLCVFFSFFFNGGMCLCMCVCVCVCVFVCEGGGGGKGGSILMARSTSPKMRFSIKDFFSKCVTKSAVS